VRHWDWLSAVSVIVGMLTLLPSILKVLNVEQLLTSETTKTIVSVLSAVLSVLAGFYFGGLSREKEK